MGRGSGGVAGGTARRGGAWLLLLADGAEILVSARFAATARDRGWLRVRR